MILTPFRFFEVKEEELGTNTTQLAEAEFGIASKALDPIDVVLAAANSFSW